jgi:hypothetical protein
LSKYGDFRNLKNLLNLATLGEFSQNILSMSLCTQYYVKKNPNYLNTSKITMGAQSGANGRDSFLSWNHNRQ